MQRKAARFHKSLFLSPLAEMLNDYSTPTLPANPLLPSPIYNLFFCEPLRPDANIHKPRIEKIFNLFGSCKVPTLCNPPRKQFKLSDTKKRRKPDTSSYKPAETLLKLH